MMKKMNVFYKILSISVLFASVFLLTTKTAFANGIVSGSFVGPHGDSAAVDYTFTKGVVNVSGTTAIDGSYSVDLADGNWSLIVIPPADFEYARNISIPHIPVTTGQTFNLGEIRFDYMVPDGADSDLEDFMSLPPICSQVAGVPTIIRADYEDATKGSFLYVGRGANVIVVADSDNYTVKVDYSFVEGVYDHAPFSDPAYVETATSMGSGRYKATHVLSTGLEGGGMPIVKVTTNDGSSSSYTCLTSGPINLDIRSFFTGPDTTDFTTVTDFRRIDNFTMHQDNLIKITFSKAINMLDPTVQRFMKSIGAKMVSQNGYVDLDAKAVLELKNAGAVITMYNVHLNNPRIMVDGVDDVAGVASGISYDQATGILIFRAAHFTSFQAVESSSGNVVTASIADVTNHAPPSCTDLVSMSVPDLFEIDRQKTQATLYFTPVNDRNSYYYIAYGLSEGDKRYGVSLDYGYSSGVISYTIYHLDPNTNYFFSVRGGNGCATGEWSSELSTHTSSNQDLSKFYKYN